MRPLLCVLRLLLSASPFAMAKGALLSIVVLLMGAALLGLSGWFITATGLAGVAGIGIAFDVFRPSAGVRLLALGRAVARYGERLFTHDATLYALAALRVSLLKRFTRGNARDLMQARSESVLNRIISDVDALDGLLLRLVLPCLAALVTHAVVFVALGLLTDWHIAVALLLTYLIFGTAVLIMLGRGTFSSAAAQEDSLQTLRHGVIDMIRDREQLIVSGLLPDRIAALENVDEASRTHARRLDTLDRVAGMRLSVIVGLGVAITLWGGSEIVLEFKLDPAVAAISVFVAMALAETLLPLCRGFAELGRMAGAAERVAPVSTAMAEDTTSTSADFEADVLSIPKLDVSLERGKTLALVGPSGSGKTTLLLKVAGLLDPEALDIKVFGQSPEKWSETAFREQVAMVSQRSVLIAGTVEENLKMAGDVSEQEMWDALELVCLDETLKARGGLQTCLGDGGAGLSGGEARRLTLARAILKKPALLLLDEPTEGLDGATEDRVLTNLREKLPKTAIVATTHRRHNHSTFDYTLSHFC